jgi:hypothetical protein
MARTRFYILIVGLIVVLSGRLWADSSQTTSASGSGNLQQLRTQMAKMAKRLAELEKNKAAATLSGEQKKLIQDMISDSAKNQSLQPNWLDGLTFYGDFRLRMQSDSSNKAGGDRNRGRYRLRFGFEKRFNDEWLVGFRLASGDNNIATSTNQSMGGAFSKKAIWVDLAYATYTPKDVPGLLLTAGKIKNPLVHTGMTWDSDVNPEGVAGLYSWGSGAFKPYVAAGWFLGFETGGRHDVTLFALQGGFNWQINKTTKWTSAATWYDWEDVGTFNTVNTPMYGNSSGVGGFRTVNLTNKLAFAVPNPFTTKHQLIPMSTTLDLIHNCGDQETASRWKGNDFGMFAEINVGKNKKKGDLSANYGYFYIEANATPGYFLDSSFGGANSQGHVFGVTYSVFEAMTIRGQVYLTQPIITPGNSSKDKDLSARIELLWKF